MRIVERVQLIIYSLLLVILSSMVLAMAAGWTTPLELANQAFRDVNNRWAIGLVALLLLIAGLKSLANNFQLHAPAHTLISSGSLGEVRMTVSALENLVTKASNSVKGVREVKPRIKTLPGGVALFIQAAVNPELNIPSVTQQLQQEVAAYIQEYAGIEVLEVKVLVENVSRETKGRVD